MGFQGCVTFPVNADISFKLLACVSLTICLYADISSQYRVCAGEVPFDTAMASVCSAGKLSFRWLVGLSIALLTQQLEVCPRKFAHLSTALHCRSGPSTCPITGTVTLAFVK